MKGYQYKDYWVEIFLDEEGDRVVCSASIEFPKLGGVISLPACFTEEEAVLAANRLIDLEVNEEGDRHDKTASA